MLGIMPKTGSAWAAKMKDSSGISFKERAQLDRLSGPIPYELMIPGAQAAFKDFEFFRRAHFGRISSPWQVDAAYKFQQALDTPYKEYINLNCPPGAGKSTLLHDIECWLTVRNRAIRGMVGSATGRLAKQYCKRLLRSFERPNPPQADPAQVAAGRAIDPIASLTKWYGRFQPDDHDLWRQEEFIIAQFGDIAVGEKEPTWQAFGFDQEYLGNRVDIAVWDDLVTKRTMRTIEAIEQMRSDWDDEAEVRIEPGGALFGVGQRLGALDLYAYNKAKLAGLSSEDEDEWDFDEDDDDPYENQFEINPEGSQVARMYHSFVYPAHDDSRCKGNHSMKTPRYWAPDDPDACLLDPIRLPWRELRQKQKSNMEKYRVVYQQEDVDPNSVLVPRVYVTGGTWKGEELPGCYDSDRGHHELPRNLNTDTYSIVTVDPSPTQWWSIQWWLYDGTTELRHLMELIRQKLGADEFLDWIPNAQAPGGGTFVGQLEDLWQLSHKLGRPFKFLILERNAAQRFLGQMDQFRRWCALRGVSYFPHDTFGNKSDPDFGVQILATQYRHGRVRLPNKNAKGDMGFIISRMLVDEVTVWPDGATDDCVMAQWFLEWWLPRIVTPDISDMPKQNRPSWLKGQVA